MNNFIEDVKKKRKSLNNENIKALLILDGHSTRMQIDLWKSLKELNVDVLCLPSHTSNVTQPLDASPNGRFKYLLEDISFPKKSELENKLTQFVVDVSDAIQLALTHSCIRSGFIKTFVINKNNNLDELKKSVDSFLESIPQKIDTKLKVFFILYYF
jgi:hypothetical protein